MAFTIPDKKDGFVENHPFIALFGSLALIPALWLYGVFSYGYVLTRFWNHLIVPTFHVDPFVWLQGLYLATFVGFFIQQLKHTDKVDEKNFGTTIFTGLISPWAILLGGWLVWHFFPMK